MSVITTNASLTVSSFPGMRCIHRMSGGKLVALVDDASGGPTYYVSADAGATWDAGTPLPSPAPPELWSGFHSQVVSDVLYIWYRGLRTDVADIHLYRASWTGTAFSAASSQTYTVPGAANVGCLAGAFLLSGIWYVAVASGSGSLYLFATDGSATYHQSASLWSTSGWDGCAILVTAGSPVSIVATVGDAGQNATLAFSGSYAAGVWTINRETVPALTASALHWMEFDSTGAIDLIWSQGSVLYTKKRTGQNAYGGIIELAQQNTTDPTFQVGYEASTGNAITVYDSAANNLNGEIYAVKRVPAGWGLPSAVATHADYAGVFLLNARCGAAITAALADVLFLAWTGSGPGSMEYLAVPVAPAPGTPFGLSPNGGGVSTLTPLLSWQTGLAPYNTLSAHQILAVITHSDLTTTSWDSGIVASSANSHFYNGPTLVFGDIVSWRVRDRDTVTGAWSSYSSPARFSLVIGGALSILEVIVGGTPATASPVGLTVPVFQVVARWAQTEGHGARDVQVKFWDASGTTLLASFPLYTFPNPLTAGGQLFSHLAAGATTLLVTPADSPRYFAAQQIELNDGTHTDIVRVTGESRSRVVAQINPNVSFTDVYLTAGDGGKFHTGENIQLGEGAGSEIISPYAIFADTIVTFPQLTYNHVGQQVWSNYLTISPSTHDYDFGGSGTMIAGAWTSPLYSSDLIVTGTDYQISVVMTDDVTGITSESGKWLLEAVFVPPAAPAAFDVVPVNNGAYYRASWDVLAAGTTMTLYQRLHGTTDWVLAAQGVTGTSEALFTTLIGRSYDFRGIATDAAGIPSLPAEKDDVTLGLAYGFGAVSLTNPFDPFNETIPVGFVSSYSSSTSLPRPDDLYIFRPKGGTTNKVSASPQDTYEVTGRSYKIPVAISDGAGGLLIGQDFIDAVERMSQAHLPILYRDYYRSFYIQIRNVNPGEMADSQTHLLTFDFGKADDLGFLSLAAPPGTDLGGFLTGLSSVPGVALPGGAVPTG